MDMVQQPAQRTPHIRKVAYWLPNQLVVTHHSLLNFAAGKEEIIASLDLEILDNELATRFGYQLTPFTSSDLPRTYKPDKDHDEDDSIQQRMADSSQQGNDAAARKNSLQSPTGKYVFPHPTGEGTLVISFFHVDNLNKSADITEPDSTTNAVKLINDSPRIFDKDSNSKLVAAMPNWFNGGTNGGPDIITHGCPVAPPMPVSASDTCSSGDWHITLPSELPASIQNATGAGVTVFVLDTLPTSEQIWQAVANSGDSNALLLDFAEHVTLNYQFLSDALDASQVSQPATGNDINGELTGFPMSDHGVFIAGIIRDLAPGAKVECIRVLNDYGVGDTVTLMDALNQIQGRLLDGTINTPVVVNMSLTTAPPVESLATLGFNDQNNIAAALQGLLLVMLSLEQSKVVFTASSGNGSGPHDQDTNPPGKCVQPRYPAAFAYPFPGASSESETLQAMIPVGAVNQLGVAASYSNYPGALGIAAYGGEAPQPSPVGSNTTTGTQAQQPIDAPRGIYTANFYPALSASDPLPMQSPPPVSYPEYVLSPAVTWAYWTGTSFATPIISALAARVMETQPPVGDSVRQTLLNAAPSQVDWINLYTGGDAWGQLIMTKQECKSDVIK